MHNARVKKYGTTDLPPRMTTKTLVSDDGRICIQCAQYKPWSGYHAHKNSSTGYEGRCKECVSLNWKVRKYGRSIEQLLSLFESAGYRCEICSTELTAGSACIDHDHACCDGDKSCGNCVRGILCSDCNAALGLFRDDQHRIRAAAEYLSAN